jgi:hypothetical protein
MVAATPASSAMRTALTEEFQCGLWKMVTLFIARGYLTP